MRRSAIIHMLPMTASYFDIFVGGGLPPGKVDWSRTRLDATLRTAALLESQIEAAPRVFKRCFDMIATSDVPAFGETLARSTKVSTVSLRRTSSMDGFYPQCVADFLRSVLSMPSLRTLDVRWVDLERHFDVFLAAMKASPSLQHLYLFECSMKQSQWLTLALAVREHPTIIAYPEIVCRVGMNPCINLNCLYFPEYRHIVRQRGQIIVHPHDMIGNFKSVLFFGLSLSVLQRKLEARHRTRPDSQGPVRFLGTVGLRMCELEHGTLDFAMEWLQDVRVLDISHCGFGASDGQMGPKKKKVN